MTFASSDTIDQMLACLPRLRRYARALVCDRATADDLVQDTVERGWAALNGWQRGTDMRAWLFSIMHNLRVDQARRGVLHTESLDDDTPLPPAPEQITAGLELRDMASALQVLSEEQREILLLVGLEEMRYEDVARLLGIPVGTVMSRLSRAREKLRALMDGRAPVVPLRVVK